MFLGIVCFLFNTETSQISTTITNKNIRSTLNLGTKSNGLITAPIPIIKQELRTEDPTKLPYSHVCIFFNNSNY